MPPKKRQRSVSPKPGSSNKKANISPSTKRPQSNKERKQWKQQQIHDYNTHQFLDASATVHAGLFGARRLPEIKSLWRGMVQGELNGAVSRSEHQDSISIRRAGESGGGKISSRHLRRRTNSHRKKLRHRFPRTGGKEDPSSGDVSASVENTKQCGAVVEDSTSQKCRTGASGKVEKSSDQKQKCRRARRKPALLKASHSHWGKAQTHAQVMAQTLSSTQSDKPKLPHKWVPTHLWHAKRFHVSPPLFSWSIPLLHCNRGSRASMRLASSKSSPKCTIQDGTWEVNGCAIRIEMRKAEHGRGLVAILQRLCGSDAPFLNEESVIMGKQAGEGLIHEIDACPLQPIGPASFFFGPSNTGEGSESTHHASILIHPSIHQKVVALLTTILQHDAYSDGQVTISTTPLTLLRIRGRASTSTICEVLGKARHLLDADDNHHGSMIEIDSNPKNQDAESMQNPITRQCSILLKSHQPNQAYRDLPHNVACSGWDILCHPSIGFSVFHSLVNDGGACPIGLVEDARAQLEAYPPLPIFPRDYPDTEEGKAYWNGSHTASSARNDWIIIRACVEGSWGRINTTLKRTIRHWKEVDDQERSRKEEKKVRDLSLDERTSTELVTKDKMAGREETSIYWPSLIAPDAESTIVVRGSFGIPFLQLLHGCGRLHQPESNENKNTHKRRPRRKVRPPNSIVAACPLSKDDSGAHSKTCQELKASLSLPAMLRCELVCDGRGTLNVGDLVLPLTSPDLDTISEASDSEDGDEKSDEDTSPLPLGVVVAGGFSPSRGKCHGICFVGAARLIDALDGTIHGKGMLLPQSDGQKKMMLQVMIVRDNAHDNGRERFALLSILL